MPRQIIDTESSRPAYVRRIAVRWVVAIVVLALVAIVAFEVLKSHPHLIGAAIVPVPGKFGAQGNLGPIPQYRRGHAA